MDNADVAMSGSKPSSHNLYRGVVTTILAIVFLFSGFVKCADPVGTSVFVEKYLATYSLDAFLGLALPLAVLLAALELTLGVMLLLRVAQRVTAIATTLFMALFTLITVLSATVLPIGDCGCFGDAVRLSPVETLAKNLVLLPMAAYLWWGSERSKIGRNELITIAIALLLSLSLNLYSLRFKPLIEFMPFRVGVNLREEILRERQELDSQSATYLVFSNTEGEELLFESDDTECWLREDLGFVESRREVLATEPLPFAEFIVTTGQGEDCTIELLDSHPDATLLCIYSLESLRGRSLKGVTELLASSRDVVVITSADIYAVSQIVGKEVFSLDAMTLRSFIRSRVGVVELHSGVITRKCDIRDL